MTQANHADVIVIGAGIVGLANALAWAKRGLRVVVLERNLQAVGASIRNFGMVWPVGQPLGPLFDRALKSRQIWLDFAARAGVYADQAGSLHLAYRPDEMAVLEEFVAARGDVHDVQLLTPSEAFEKSPAVLTEGLLGALWSPTEVIVDPREAIATLPTYLAKNYGVECKFGTVVTDIADGVVQAGGEIWKSDRIFLCSGADFETLYPQEFANSGITKVKLQMMRTVPQPENWRLGAALCGGLTLTHYASFADCPSLPALKERIAKETPHFPAWGIHVMMSQNGLGELIIGDSHEYGCSPDPFDRNDINQYILDYLKGFAKPPTLDIAATWHGVYAKLLGATELILNPEPQVTIVNALSGAGMTLSFGLAEEIVERSL
jgi:FAD dependent oxidoreductase TIGR03364